MFYINIQIHIIIIIIIMLSICIKVKLYCIMHVFLLFRTIPILVNGNPHCNKPRWRWKDRWSEQTSAGGGDSQDQGRPVCAETWLWSFATCGQWVAIKCLNQDQPWFADLLYVREKVRISSGLGQDCDRIWAEHPAHPSTFGCQKLYS